MDREFWIIVILGIILIFITYIIHIKLTGCYDPIFQPNHNVSCVF